MGLKANLELDQTRPTLAIGLALGVCDQPGLGLGGWRSAESCDSVAVMKTSGWGKRGVDREVWLVPKLRNVAVLFASGVMSLRVANSCDLMRLMGHLRA